MHQILKVDCNHYLLHPLQIWSLLFTPFVRITQQCFHIRRPISPNLLDALFPNFASWLHPSFPITAQGSKWTYLMDRLRQPIKIMCFRQFRQRAINKRGSGVPQHQLCFLLTIYLKIFRQKISHMRVVLRIFAEHFNFASNRQHP